MTAIDTTLNSITIVKSFEYRGAPEEWSNTYFMSGDLPSSSASWKTLADAIILDEAAILTTATTVVKAIGHKAGDSVAVWSWDYESLGTETTGTFSTTGDVVNSGDTAMWIRWSTDQLTSKGKPIYLRSYYHPAVCNASPDGDSIVSSWRTAATTYGNAWVTGFVDGDGTTHHRGGPHGVIGITPTPSTFATTRTLERRGKRPT